MIASPGQESLSLQARVIRGPTVEFVGRQGIEPTRCKGLLRLPKFFGPASLTPRLSMPPNICAICSATRPVPSCISAASSRFTSTRSTESFREDAETGFEIMASVLEDGSGPTAVFCATDELAIGAMAAARRAGRTIPDDMSFFGFDDLKLTGLMSPPLSTVSVPRFEMGRRGAEALFHQIYEGSDASNKIVLGHHLVLRESVSHI